MTVPPDMGDMDAKSWQDPPLVLLLGGSFNPPHVGHLRIAIESAEALRPGRTLFIPCAVPPHKSSRDLLPFALRCAMLRAAIADIGRESGVSGSSGRFEVSEVENERQGFSYTVDTLAVLAARFAGERLAFIMGGEDYARLSTWKGWRELPELADIVVLPRSEGGEEAFRRDSLEHWPEARLLEPETVPAAVATAYILPRGGRLLYLPQPLLDVSSSLVRERFLARRSLDFLVPPGVAALLREHHDEVNGFWSSSD